MHYFAFKTHLRGDPPPVQDVVAKYAIEIAHLHIQFSLNQFKCLV